MKYLIISAKLLVLMTILTGIAYPLIIFATGSIMFPQKSSGSIIYINGKIAGSGLIAQKFESPLYFNSRPSAVDYNPLPSGGSNLGPTSRQLRNTIDSLRQNYTEFNRTGSGAIVPPDALFASGSGLDPHISYENAMLQSVRIAEARKFSPEKRAELERLIARMTEKPQFGILGEPVINVLELNIELDKL